MEVQPRKYAIIETNKRICAQICCGGLQLPEGVRVDAHIESIARDMALIRLSGIGLPEAYEVEKGGIYGRVGFEISDSHPPQLVLLFGVDEEKATAVTNAGTIEV